MDASVVEEFTLEARKAAEAVSLGDPFTESTNMGPLCNEMTAAKMDAHVADAVASGAEVLTGGGRRSEQPTDLYYELTVLSGVTEQMLVSREESFGPIVPIIAANGDDEALRLF